MIGAMIIAVDGSAASGKGTLSKRLADHFNLAHLDTGSLFRALALQLLNAGTEIDIIDKNQAIEESSRLDLGLCIAPEIRTDRVASLASKVAILPELRANLLTLQRNFANNPPHGNGAVLDGRDIGSVVVPETPIKLFIDAKLEVRAERRFKELLHAGQSVIFRDVLADMRERDQRDRNRSVAPLRAADGAKTIDTSTMDADKVFAVALDHVKHIIGT
jgi:cytidylate kinase